ncbi:MULTISPECIES: hypothetical protein [Staphylococcus]|uniref:hypothetical protein n=1 Tax=Staphylococcus TaxID=1279 RepID=UPI0015827282|nr:MULTISPECIES: hypothetical protein [Staphylococcus]MEB7460536.1 hypothetical protein [Staphylococcus borealis]NUI93663.1 hypothetical protein [Staphylococcus borealis]
MNKNDEIDKTIEINIINFLITCLYVNKESNMLKNTVLENSNLKKYIENGLIDDLDILSQVIDAKNKDN